MMRARSVADYVAAVAGKRRYILESPFITAMHNVLIRFSRRKHTHAESQDKLIVRPRM